VPVSNPPEVFGKYHLLEKIATGGMAEVWRARSYGLAGFEKILVIKRVLDTLAKDEEFIRLFIDEARIASQLLHVNIVQVFDLGEVGGSYYMAMEYVHGLDLARLYSRARRLGFFPVPIALFIISEVLKALQFAHEQTDDNGLQLGIVHCDISPQNVLISHAGEVKITDFGISRAAFQAAGTHDVVRGKYAYMSPEQVEGRKLDGRSDIFSAGIMMWELLTGTGRRLFKMRNREETLARVKRADVPSLCGIREEVSEELESIVLKSLARKTRDRYTSAGEMLDELSSLMVREGHRATSSDLAIFMREVLESASTSGRDGEHRRLSGASRTLPPSAMVVMAAEASAPPRSIAAPRFTLAGLLEEWSGVIAEADGEPWEVGEGSMLVAWVVKEALRETLARAVATALQLQRRTSSAGYRLSCGIAPGVCRLETNTRRPASGWELAGPFYLSRWMMNLSAHRGRVLVTEVGKRQVTTITSLLGRIPIEGNKYINIYEVG
jgi:serine/threonine protein kinase